MKMPLEPRIGWWGNYGFQKAFKPAGRWIGGQLPREIIGHTFRQELMEGVLEYQLNVLFDREKPRREQLELILMFKTRDIKIIEAMWQYETWEKDIPNVEEVHAGIDQRVDASPQGSNVPW